LVRQDLVVALNGDQFRSRMFTSHALHGSGANAENVREYGAHFLRGGAVDGSALHAHLERAVVRATDSALGRAWVDAYAKADHGR